MKLAWSPAASAARKRRRLVREARPLDEGVDYDAAAEVAPRATGAFLPPAGVAPREELQGHGQDPAHSTVAPGGICYSAQHISDSAVVSHASDTGNDRLERAGEVKPGAMPAGEQKAPEEETQVPRDPTEQGEGPGVVVSEQEKGARDGAGGGLEGPRSVEEARSTRGAAYPHPTEKLPSTSSEPSVGGGSAGASSSQAGLPSARSYGEASEKLRAAEATSSRLQEEGNALAQEGQFPQALQKWGAALALTPARGRLHESRAQVFLEMGDTWQAVQAATRAVEVEPDWAEGWLTLSRAQLNLGEPQLALESASTANRLAPKREDVLQELRTAQWLLARQRQMEHAREDDAARLAAGGVAPARHQSHSRVTVVDRRQGSSALGSSVLTARGS